MTKNTRQTQSLFQWISRDGTCWLFVAQGDGGWAITRNGEGSHVGTGERASVASGVRRFLTVMRTAPAVRPSSAEVRA